MSLELGVWHWNPIPHITSADGEEGHYRPCDNSDVHEGHFHFDGAIVCFCVGVKPALPATFVVCQVVTDVEDVLPCSYRESGGKKCERLDPHGDTGHFFGRHTITHEIAGNGYSCEYIEKVLKESDKALDNPVASD